MADLNRSGGCVCEAVQFTCSLAGPEIHACHCKQCQRWTGGGPLINVRIDAITIKDDSTVGRFHASEWGERCFCKTCGSTLFWKMQGKPVKSIAVGLLDDQSDLTMTEEIFVDHRPDWLPVWADAGQSTEDQEFAKLEDYLKGETR
jgi:hypothetical protein